MSNARNLADAETRFVNAAGDTITGGLNVTGGRVGIGTSSPTSVLHASSSSNTALSLQTSNASSSVSTNYTSANRTFYTGVDIGGANSAYTIYDGTAGAERMRIDSAGRVTMPYQPAFKALGNYQNQTFTVGTTFAFPYAYFNVGSHYNTATSLFTAPVSGVYFFTAQLFFNDTYVDRLGFKINGNLSTDPYGGHRSGINGGTDVLTYMVKLSAGDSVGVCAQYGDHTLYGYHSGFEGILLA